MIALILCQRSQPRQRSERLVSMGLENQSLCCKYLRHHLKTQAPTTQQWNTWKRSQKKSSSLALITLSWYCIWSFHSHVPKWKILNICLSEWVWTLTTAAHVLHLTGGSLRAAVRRVCSEKRPNISLVPEEPFTRYNMWGLQMFITLQTQGLLCYIDLHRCWW